MKRVTGLVAIMILGVLPLLYNSCSSTHEGRSSSSLFGKSSCAAMFEVFKTSYSPFLRNNCATCHVPGGLGKGSFASGNLEEAFKSFELSGFSKVNQYAVNPSHQPPYTGKHQQGPIDQITEVWVKGLQDNAAACDGDASSIIIEPGPRVKTRSKGLNFDWSEDEPDAITLTWDLNSELIAEEDLTVPSLPGAILEVRVEARRSIENVVTFHVSNPRIRNSQVDIEVKSLVVNFNGSPSPGKPTFGLVDEQIRAGENVLLNAGGKVIDGDIRSSDVIAISFGTLQVPDDPIPPPPTGPTVNFALATDTTPEGTQWKDITLTLSEASTRYVTVGLSINGQTEAKPICCVNITNEDQESIDINHFDWDYKIPMGLTVQFEPGETSKNLRIEVSNDDRWEPGNETLVVDINQAGVFNAVVGNVSRHTLTITDDDTEYMGLARKYSDLLKPGGVLFVNCLGCHNSVDEGNNGGYDITNYQMMIDNNILIPGDVDSKMFVRMNSEIDGLPPMPFTGLLQTEQRRDVQDWIREGALNN